MASDSTTSDFEALMRDGMNDPDRLKEFAEQINDENADTTGDVMHIFAAATEAALSVYRAEQVISGLANALVAIADLSYRHSKTERPVIIAQTGERAWASDAILYELRERMEAQGLPLTEASTGGRTE